MTGHRSLPEKSTPCQTVGTLASLVAMFLVFAGCATPAAPSPVSGLDPLTSSETTSAMDPFDPNAPGTRRIRTDERVVFEANQTFSEQLSASSDGSSWTLGEFNPPTENHSGMAISAILKRQGLHPSGARLEVVASDGFLASAGTFGQPFPPTVSSVSRLNLTMEGYGAPPWQVRYETDGPNPGANHQIHVTVTARIHTG